MKQRINNIDFYSSYHGHKVHNLNTLYFHFKNKDKNFVYLLGDSSMDNKFWLPIKNVSEACNGYEDLLIKPIMKEDIAYHLNRTLCDNGINKVALNCAIEESTLKQRENQLMRQDRFARDRLTHNDTLIISLGGNDIALKPTTGTIWNMIKLIGMNSIKNIKKGPNHAWGMPYFVNMFKCGIEDYIRRVCEKNIPEKVIVCMIYFPDTTNSTSWANKTLGALGYNSNPAKLQEAIKQIYHHAIQKINIQGINIIPFPMYSILDGSNTGDYIQRVEPSSAGGKKLANAFFNIIVN